MSSKRQVKEKGRSGWSPVKTSAPSKEPPPLPPLVSDLGAQLERVGDRSTEPTCAAPGLLPASSQGQHHLEIIQGSDKQAPSHGHRGSSRGGGIV